MPHRALRTLAATTAALVLAGCGAGEDPLPAADLERALLTADTLGAGWVEEPDSEEATEGPRGTGADCLDDADELDAIEPVDKASASFTWTSGTLSVANGVGSYDDAEEVTTQFDESFEKLEDCSEISNEAGGATLEAQISSDRSTSSEQVDAQLNIEARGSYRAGGQSQDFTILITLAQVGAHVTTVQTVGTADVAAAHASYVAIAVDRLAAVTDGEDPPETVAPSPELG